MAKDEGDNAAPDSEPAIGSPEQPHSPALFLAMGVVCALIAGGILWLMVSKAEVLARFGLVERVYYVVVVALAVFSAVALFGIMRSYAIVTGNLAAAKYRVGGAAALFVIMLWVGSTFNSPSQPFVLTVFVHGDGGPQDLVLRNRGSIMLDLGVDRRRAPIGEDGQAIFPGIPSNFRGQSIKVLVDAPGYEMVEPKSAIEVAGDNAYVSVRRRAAEFSGYVRSAAGQPLAAATISMMGKSTQSDAAGFFTLTLPGAATREAIEMQVVAQGFVPWMSEVTPGSNEIVIALDPVTPAPGNK